MSETEDTEAGEVAGQLKRLYEAGAIKDHADAAFYARFIVMFGALVCPNSREGESREEGRK